jgi:hypothetical protein
MTYFTFVFFVLLLAWKEIPGMKRDGLPNDLITLGIASEESAKHLLCDAQVVMIVSKSKARYTQRHAIAMVQG